MENEDVAAPIIQAYSRRYQRYSLPAGRAEQLAREVATLNDAVLDLLGEFRFEDDPAAFLRVLEAGKETRPKVER